MSIKQISVAIGVIAVAVGAGFVGGRYSTPTRTEYKEKIVYQDRTVEVNNTKQILEAIATMQKQVNQQKDVRTVKVIEKAPDGTTKVTVTTDDKTKTDTKTDTKVDTQVKTEIQTKKEEVRIETKEITKIVERDNGKWSFSLQPGIDFAGALGHGTPYSLLPSDLALKHIVVGATIERKLFGPISTGVWFNTYGSGGLVFRITF